MHEHQIVTIIEQEAVFILVKNDAFHGFGRPEAFVQPVPSRMSRSSIWAKALPLPGFTCSTLTVHSGRLFNHIAGFDGTVEFIRYLTTGMGDAAFSVVARSGDGLADCLTTSPDRRPGRRPDWYKGVPRQPPTPASVLPFRPRCPASAKKRIHYRTRRGPAPAAHSTWVWVRSAMSCADHG